MGDHGDVTPEFVQIGLGQFAALNHDGKILESNPYDTTEYESDTDTGSENMPLAVHAYVDHRREIYTGLLPKQCLR